MNRFRQTSLALSLVAICGSVNAEHAYNDDRYPQQDTRSDFARVTHVERVGNTYGSRQRQECWNESSNRHEIGYYRDSSGRLYRGDGSSSKSGALVGAIIGGAIGNQVGSGDGRRAATVAGAVIGGVIGSKQGRDDGYDHYRDDAGVVVRCRTVAERAGNRGGRGYYVTYAYGGQSYQTFTNTRPGRTLRVLVDVRPQEAG